MKKYPGKAMIMVFCCFCAIAGWAAAGDTVRVPESLIEIGDLGLRKALQEHSPNYDELSRGSQVFTFVHVYKWHEGKTPQLSPQDAALMPAASSEVETHPSEVVDVDSIHIDDTAPTSMNSSVDWFDNPSVDAEYRGV